jgi:outer membrane protein assembly factor BamD
MQQLRNVQEVLAQREYLIGQFYESVDNYPAAIARLQTVADTYPLFSRSDQVLIDIGDCYEGEAHNVAIASNVPGAVRERLRTIYLNKAAAAYDEVITRYPMDPHVEDARDRLVVLNRPIPEPTQAEVAESDAEERSRQPLHFADRTLGLIKRGPTVVEAAHVGQPTLTDPPRIIAPDITRENIALYQEALGAGRPSVPAVAATPTPVNEPPRTGQPSQAPLQLAPPGGSTGVGVSIVSAPSGPVASPVAAASNPNAVVKPVGPASTVLPPVQKPAEAPIQVNDIKPGEVPVQSAATAQAKEKKPKANLSTESSSRKKKKKGLGKLNPF